MRRLIALVAALALVTALAAVQPAASAAPSTRASTPALLFTPCSDLTAYQCGNISVPVDYRRPNGSELSLAVIRRPATGPGPALGTLFFNPGGPGESGVQILPVVANLLPSGVTSRFNLVSFDERGTGASELLQCGPTPTEAAAIAPFPARTGSPLPAARLYAGLAQACARTAPQLVANMATTDSARDMDRIRAALGLRQISYYGLSYGTVLGSVYARLFPTHLHAAVLDGAVLATLPLTTQAAEEAPAVDAALTHWFTTCAATACAGGVDPATLYRQVATRLAQSPLPAPGGGENFVPVTLGDLYSATLLFLSVPKFAPSYPTALLDAAHGDGGPLRSLSLTFQQDLNGSSLVGPEWTITCEDSASRPSGRALGVLARQLATRYPLASGYTPTYIAAGCSDWPAATDPITSVALHSGPHVLVVGNTIDPNTPHQAAVQLTRALGRAHLLTWMGEGHTWLLNGSQDSCMAAAVTAYLATARPPASGTVCP